MTMTLSHQLGRVVPPTPEEARELARRWRDAGDLAARNQLVERNIPLATRAVAAVARSNPKVWDDLLGASMIGLLAAADRFDPGRDLAFSTYASYWIRQAITAWFEDEYPLIRVPRYLHHALSRARRGLAYSSTRAHPTHLAEAAHALTATASGSGRSGSPAPLDEVAAAAAEAGLDRRDSLARLALALDELDARQATILRLRFGMGGGEPMTLREVGEHLGLTRERIRQVEKEARGRLALIMGGER